MQAVTLTELLAPNPEREAWLRSGVARHASPHLPIRDEHRAPRVSTCTCSGCTGRIGLPPKWSQR